MCASMSKRNRGGETDFCIVIELGKKKKKREKRREVKIELLFFLSGLILKATRVPMYVACYGNMSAQSYPAVSWGAWLALEGRPALTTFFQYFGGTLEASRAHFFVCMYVCNHHDT